MNWIVVTFARRTGSLGKIIKIDSIILELFKKYKLRSDPE